MEVTGAATPLAVFVLAFGVTAAHAQTSTLEPFMLDGHLAVGTLAGRRPLTRVDLRLSGPDDVGAVPTFQADDTSTIAPWDARLTALLQRDIEGELLSYQPTGLYTPRPKIWLQNATRWIEPQLSEVKAPAQGSMTHDWFLDGLCSVSVSVWSGDPDVRIKRLTLEASNDFWASGFSGETEGTGPLQQSEGFVRAVVDGRDAIVGELLVRPGDGLMLEVEATYEGDHSTKKALSISANPLRCASEPTPQALPLITLPPPAIGRVEGAFRLTPDPSLPIQRRPSVTSILATMQPGNGTRTIELSGMPDPVDGVARRSEPLPASPYSFELSALLEWPDGLYGSLTLGHDVAGAHFSPVVPLPVSPGPQQGFYPDLSVVVSGGEVESLVLDDTIVAGEGRLSPFGCMTAADLESGQASWQTTAPAPAQVRTELGILTSDEPFPTLAFGPVVPGTDRFLLAALEGEWRESFYSLRFRRPPAGAGQAGVVADLQMHVDPLLARLASFSVGTALALPPRDLPVGAVTVTLRVLDPTTGLARPFQSPEVSITDQRGELGSLIVRAYGDQTLRELHRVVVPSLPGVYNLAITAQVPQNPADPGAVVVTALPTLLNVPFRAPRPDGSCAAICNDPGVNVYWDDDLAPPVIQLADVPLRVYEPFVDLTGVAFDESPIMGVQAGQATATLDGDDTSPHRAFSVRVPVDEHTQSVTVTARDRCGGEVTITRPVSLWSNTPPSISSLVLTAREGEPLEASMDVSDPDAADVQAPQPLTFTLALDDVLPGESTPVIDASTGLLSWTPGFEQSGTWTFRVTVSDGVAVDEAQVVIEVQEVNRPPVIERVGSVPVTGLLAFPVAEGGRLELVVEAVDPDSDEVSFTAFGVESGLPPGLTLSPDGVLSWAPAFDQGGDHVIEVIASDGRGGEDRQVLLLRVGNFNRAPLVEGPSLKIVAEGEPFELEYVAKDPDGQPVLWSLEPEALRLRGLALETSGDTARLRWTPGYGDSGDYVITVAVTDPEGATGQAPLVLQVTNTNRAPTFAPVSPPVAAGWPGGFDVLASDPDGQAITCAATQLPEGVSWDAEHRRVSWDDLLWPQGLLRVTVVCSDGEADGVLEIDVKSEHFDLVGGCNCAATGTGAWALLVLAMAMRRRRPRQLVSA